MLTFILRGQSLLTYVALIAMIGFADTIFAADCDHLKSLALPATTLDEVAAVAAGTQFPAWAMVPGAAPTVASRAFCRVQGTIRPSPTSTIKFEVWLPTDWNGKFNQVGNGGLGGSMPHGSLTEALAKGYATAATDDGTAPVGDISWLLDPERIKDYGYRAVHETALRAEALIVAFYGRKPAHAYFTGGSKGGQEALMEAQRYPGDFDGVAGWAPGADLTGVMMHHLWGPHVMTKTPESDLSEAKITMLHNAVMASCAGKDGGLDTDKWLTNPLQCTFKPETLLCNGAETPQCLTAPQLETARAIYAGAHNPRTGELITYGLPLGSEGPQVGGEGLGGLGHGWVGSRGAIAKALGGPFFAYSIKRDPKWDWRQFDFDHDAALARKIVGPSTDALNADLSSFKARGGKLLITHGWDDPFVPSGWTIHYLRSVIATQAAHRSKGRSAEEETGTFVRLFMVPGQGHASGLGPQVISQVDEISRWVEQGVAPSRIIATKYVADDPAKGVTMTRPLCPFPQAAHYSGKGDPNRAESFECVH
jgi:feruloyl esterase